MIAVDTHVLVQAHRRDGPWHDVANEIVRKLAEGRAPWAIPWPVLHEFIAVVTHAQIWDPPTPLSVALAQVSAWTASPSVQLLSETSDHWQLLAGLIARGQVRGTATHDARVAAICLGHGVAELWTFDRDFSRFPQLKTRNPLLA